MKIPPNIRSRYQELQAESKRLQGLVEPKIRACIKASWHFEGRVKSEESYALKIESGRYLEGCVVEDMYACTIVVRDFTEIVICETLIQPYFVIDDRRPKLDNATSKDSTEFVFDDLRLFCKLRLEDYETGGPIYNVVFEIQIKTYLQHAWTIATHDLVYKSDTVSWPKQRIAYQIKAMLEHAEVSIIEAERLALSPFIAKENQETARLKEIIGSILSQWSKEKLPSDLVRLSTIISNFLYKCNITVAEVSDALKAASADGKGTNTEDLSPYGVIVQTVGERLPNGLTTLWRTRRLRDPIVIPNGITLPASIGAPACNKVILL